MDNITSRDQLRSLDLDELWLLFKLLHSKQADYSPNWLEITLWAWAEIKKREGEDVGDSLWPDQEPLEGDLDEPKPLRDPAKQIYFALTATRQDEQMRGQHLTKLEWLRLFTDHGLSLVEAKKTTQALLANRVLKQTFHIEPGTNCAKEAAKIAKKVR